MWGFAQRQGAALQFVCAVHHFVHMFAAYLAGMLHFSECVEPADGVRVEVLRQTCHLQVSISLSNHAGGPRPFSKIDAKQVRAANVCDGPVQKSNRDAEPQI